MKKIISIIMVVILAFLMTACTTEPIVYDQETILELTTGYIDDMLEGDFSTTMLGMSVALRKEIDEESLKNAWDSMVGSVGEFIATVDVNYKQEGEEMAEVEIINRHDKNGIKITLTVSHKKQIEGIWLSYTPIYEGPLEGDMWIEEEVMIADGGSLDPLMGKLTLPKNVENPPVVLLLQGSGALDMDSTIGAEGNRPFKDIAHGLASYGIATLRYDKRTFTYPDTVEDLGSNYSIADEYLSDVQYALDFLTKSGAKINTEEIFLLGHSLGGMIAPKIVYDNDVIQGAILMWSSPFGLDSLLWIPSQKNKKKRT